MSLAWPSTMRISHPPSPLGPSAPTPAAVVVLTAVAGRRAYRRHSAYPNPPNTPTTNIQYSIDTKSPFVARGASDDGLRSIIGRPVRESVAEVPARELTNLLLDAGRGKSLQTVRTVCSSVFIPSHATVVSPYPRLYRGKARQSGWRHRFAHRPK